MYAYEIAWYESTVTCTGKPTTAFHFKGFKTREQLDRFVKRLKKKETFVSIHEIKVNVAE